MNIFHGIFFIMCYMDVVALGRVNVPLIIEGFVVCGGYELFRPKIMLAKQIKADLGSIVLV